MRKWFVWSLDPAQKDNVMGFLSPSCSRSAKGEKKTAEKNGGENGNGKLLKNATIDLTSNEADEHAANDAETAASAATAEASQGSRDDATLSAGRGNIISEPPPVDEAAAERLRGQRQLLSSSSSSSSSPFRVSAFGREEINVENWPLTVTDNDDSDAANAANAAPTNEATQREKSSSEVEDKDERGRLESGRRNGQEEEEEEKGRKKDWGGGGGGGGGGLVIATESCDDVVSQAEREAADESVTAADETGSVGDGHRRSAASPEPEEQSRGTIESGNEPENEDVNTIATEDVSRDVDEAGVVPTPAQNGGGQFDHSDIRKGQKNGPSGAGVAHDEAAEPKGCASVSATGTTTGEHQRKTSGEKKKPDIGERCRAENEVGKETDEALPTRGESKGKEDEADAAVSSSIAHKDEPKKDDDGLGTSAAAAAGRVPGGSGGEGVAKELSGEARPRTTHRPESAAAVTNALEQSDISRRGERKGGIDDGAHRGQECDSRGDGPEQEKGVARDNCAAEATTQTAEGGEGPSPWGRNGDAQFSGEAGRRSENKEKERRRVKAAQTVADGAAEDTKAKLSSYTRSILSVSMPEIGDPNRLPLSVSGSVSRNPVGAGNTKTRGRPPPPQVRIRLPATVDQRLLEQCQREANMSRLSSSMRRM